MGYGEAEFTHNWITCTTIPSNSQRTSFSDCVSHIFDASMNFEGWDPYRCGYRKPLSQTREVHAESTVELHDLFLVTVSEEKWLISGFQERKKKYFSRAMKQSNQKKTQLFKQIKINTWEDVFPVLDLQQFRTSCPPKLVSFVLSLKYHVENMLVLRS